MFLSDAEKHLVEGHYWLVCFEAWQAAELYIKALLVALTGVHPYTHDLVELMDALAGLGVGVSETLRLYDNALAQHYTLARYPGKKPVVYNKARAQRRIEQAKNIVSGLKRLLTHRLDVYARRLRSWEKAFNDFVESLCRSSHVVEAYLAGSRARGDNPHTVTTMSL